MKLASNFYCHVLIVARDGFITTFPTECVCPLAKFTISPFFFNPPLSPQTFLFLLSWFMYFCVWVCVSISVYSISLKLQKTWLSFWPGFLTFADWSSKHSARPVLSTFLMVDNGLFHNNQLLEFSSLSPCAGFLFCFSKCLFLASLGPGSSWTCCGPLIVLPSPPEYCDAGTHPTPSLCGSEPPASCMLA